jgi:hypothetical protein
LAVYQGSMQVISGSSTRKQLLKEACQARF